jgi:hypothetical protein
MEFAPLVCQHFPALTITHFDFLPLFVMLLFSHESPSCILLHTLECNILASQLSDSSESQCSYFSNSYLSLSEIKFSSQPKTSEILILLLSRILNHISFVCILVSAGSWYKSLPVPKYHAQIHRRIEVKPHAFYTR